MRGLGAGELSGDDTTKGAGASGVHAADQADVGLASDGACACLSLGDLGDEREVGHGAIPVPGVAARGGGGHADLLPLSARSIVVELASVGAWMGWDC